MVQSSSSSTPRSGGASVNDQSMVSKLGAVEIDWPRSIGFFGGVGLAVGVGLIDPPLGLFIAAVPFLKMLDLPRLPPQFRFVGQVFEGVAKPVGGDSEGTVRIVTGKGTNTQPVQNGS
jgi:hypothetical protein